jgi:hypothetical protein
MSGINGIQIVALIATILASQLRYARGLTTPALVGRRMHHNTVSLTSRFSNVGDNESPEIESSSMEEKKERGDSLRRALSSLNEVNTGGGSEGGLSAGSTVVPSSDIPLLGIWQFQTYALQSIFDQGSPSQHSAAGGDSIVEKIPVATLSDPISRPGYTRYITLYSPKYHEEPITITPDEVGLLSIREEVMDSLLMALPIFGFWTAVAFSFANTYNERYGGNFIDALFRT